MRLLAILGIVLLGSGAAFAAETGAAAGSGNGSHLAPQSTLEIGDVPNHQLVQAIGDDDLKTPDRLAGISFDKAKAKVFRQSDLVNGSGVVRGYATWEAPSGEKLFLIFGYAVPPFPTDKDVVSFEGTFEWIGGTGALQGVKGKGTMEGEISRRGETRYRWAGSYELAAK